MFGSSDKSNGAISSMRSRAMAWARNTLMSDVAENTNRWFWFVLFIWRSFLFLLMAVLLACVCFIDIIALIMAIWLPKLGGVFMFIWTYNAIHSYVICRMLWFLPAFPFAKHIKVRDLVLMGANIVIHILMTWAERRWPHYLPYGR